MLKYHQHIVPYYSESLMLFFVIFLALLLRGQSEEVANNKLEQLEAVFLLICDQESCVRLQCGPGNVSHVASCGVLWFPQSFYKTQRGKETLRNHSSIMFDSFASRLCTK